MKLSTLSSVLTNENAVLNALFEGTPPSIGGTGRVKDEKCSFSFPCNVLTEGPSNSKVTSVLVHLCIADYKRSSFFEHAQHLYSLTLSYSPLTPVTVIPCFPSYSSSSLPLSVQTTETDTGSSCGELFLREIREEHPEFADCFFTHVAVGGTFDRLHSGHKLLLTYAALYSTQSVLVGVASSALLNKKRHKEYLQPIDVRIEGVKRFLSTIRKDLSVEVVEIEDVYGSTDVRPELEAIILSEETQKSLDVINKARDAHGLTPLEGVTVPSVTYGPDNTLISSTTLRELAKNETTVL